MWLLIIAAMAYAWIVRRDPDLMKTWRKVFHDAPAIASSVVLVFCLFITALDSVHFRSALPPAAGLPNAAVAYDTRTRSVLDLLLTRLTDARESSYSEPLAYVGFQKESAIVKGKTERVAPRLAFGGAHLTDPQQQWGDRCDDAGVAGSARRSRRRADRVRADRRRSGTRREGGLGRPRRPYLAQGKPRHRGESRS